MILARARFRWIAWLLAFAAMVTAVSLPAQPTEGEKERAASFVESMARTIYEQAWPAATFREISYKSFEEAKGGFDLVVDLSGQSGLDGSNLWLRLVFSFRGGQLADLTVKEDNAVLLRPYATSGGFASLTARLADQYAGRQGQRAKTPETPRESHSSHTGAHAKPAEAAPANNPASDVGSPDSDPDFFAVEGACLENQTNRIIEIEYRLSNEKWKTASLEPERDFQMWWPSREVRDPSVQLELRYLDKEEKPQVTHLYALDRVKTTLPTSCGKLAKYYLDIDGTETVIEKARTD